MDSYALLLAFRLIHILGGIFWVGSAIFIALFLFPSIKAAGPNGGKVMQLLMQQRKLPLYMNLAAGLAMLSGFYLYGRMISMSPAWGGSTSGMVFGLGGVAAVLAGIVGGAVNGRAGKRMATLGAEIQASGGAPTEEQKAEIDVLQKRLGFGLKFVTIFLTISSVCMAIARYV